MNLFKKESTVPASKYEQLKANYKIAIQDYADLDGLFQQFIQHVNHRSYQTFSLSEYTKKKKELLERLKELRAKHYQMGMSK